MADNRITEWRIYMTDEAQREAGPVVKAGPMVVRSDDGSHVEIEIAGVFIRHGVAKEALPGPQLSVQFLPHHRVDGVDRYIEHVPDTQA